MSFSLFASDFRGSFPRPGPFLPVSGHRRMYFPLRSPPWLFRGLPSALRRLGFSEVSGRRAAFPTAGPAQSPSPRFPRCPLRTPFPASFEVQPSFETFRGRKMALRGSRGRPGASGAEVSPLPQARSVSGSSCGRGLPAVCPPFWLPEARRAVFSFPADPKGCWGLEGPHRGVLGPPRAVLPLRPGLLPGPWPIFGSQKPAGPFSAPGRCWKRWKRSCGLKARTGASWGRPGAARGRLRAILFSPAARASLLSPFPPSLFFNPLYVDSRRRGERERRRSLQIKCSSLKKSE